MTRTWSTQRSTRPPGSRPPAGWSNRSAKLICGVAFVPRWRVVTVDGAGDRDLSIPVAMVRTVRSAVVDGTALSAGETADLTVDGAARAVWQPDGHVWPHGRRNVVLGVEHGHTSPPRIWSRPRCGGCTTCCRPRSRVRDLDRAMRMTVATGQTYDLAKPSALYRTPSRRRGVRPVQPGALQYRWRQRRRRPAAGWRRRLGRWTSTRSTGRCSTAAAGERHHVERAAGQGRRHRPPSTLPPGPGRNRRSASGSPHHRTQGDRRRGTTNSDQDWSLLGGRRRQEDYYLQLWINVEHTTQREATERAVEILGVVETTLRATPNLGGVLPVGQWAEIRNRSSPRAPAPSPTRPRSASTST